MCADTDCGKKVVDKDFHWVGDLEHMRADDADACIELCMNYEGNEPCNAITYIGGTRTCYIKHVPAGAMPVVQDMGRKAVAYRLCGE